MSFLVYKQLQPEKGIPYNDRPATISSWLPPGYYGYGYGYGYHRPYYGYGYH